MLEKVKTKANHEITRLVIPQSALAFVLDLLLRDNPKAKVTIQGKPEKG